MKQSGVMPLSPQGLLIICQHNDGHYQWTSSQFPLHCFQLPRSEHVGSVTYSWCCYSSPNATIYEYLLKSLIFSRNQHVLIIYLSIYKINTYTYEAMIFLHVYFLYSYLRLEKKNPFWTECLVNTLENRRKDFISFQDLGEAVEKCGLSTQSLGSSNYKFG